MNKKLLILIIIGAMALHGGNMSATGRSSGAATKKKRAFTGKQPSAKRAKTQPTEQKNTRKTHIEKITWSKSLGHTQSSDAGYYALWNALCSVDPAFGKERSTLEIFQQNLNVFKSVTTALRESNSQDIQACLAPDELRELIAYYFDDNDSTLKNRIVVTPDFDELEVFKKDVTNKFDTFLPSIASFNEDSASQVFIIPIRKTFITLVMSQADEGIYFSAFSSHASKDQVISTQELQAICPFFRDMYVEKKPMSVTSQKSLQQGRKTGLHCGYYALWNAWCGVDTTQQQNRCVVKEFNKHLTPWETQIHQIRANQGGVDNLESNELEILIRTFLPRFGQHIIVIPSMNYFKEFRNGASENDQLLESIRTFRNTDNSSLAFVVNTGGDYGQRQRGTNHFLSIVLHKNGDQYSADHFDSLKNLRRSASVKTLITESVLPLVTHDDLGLLKAKQLLSNAQPKIKKYWDAHFFAATFSFDVADTEENEMYETDEARAYCSMIEEYYKELYKTVRQNQSGDGSPQAVNAHVNEVIDGLRAGSNMAAMGNNNVVTRSYLLAINEAIQIILADLREIFNEEHVTIILMNLHEETYAYSADKILDLSVKTIHSVWEKIRGLGISVDRFIDLIRDYDIAADVVQAFLDKLIP